MQYLKLLYRFRLFPRFRKLIGEHQPNVRLVGTEIREFRQGAESFVHPAGFLHPVRILEKVLLRVCLEAFLRADPAKLVVNAGASGRNTQDLVTERYRVVDESAVGVVVNRFFVIVGGFRDVVLLDQKVAGTVEQPDVHFLRILLHLGQQLDVNGNRFLRRFFLDVCGLLFQGGDLGHQRPEGATELSRGDRDRGENGALSYV